MAFLRFSHVDLCRPQVTFDLHEKQQGWSTNYGLPIYYVWSSSNVYFFTYRVYKVLSLWPLWTPNDLWPPWNSIGIIWSPRCTYILILKFKQLSLLEISCSQGFETLITVDPKWPLTSMKNDRDHLPTMGYLYTIFEVQATFTSSHIVLTKFSDFDFCWPQMTFDLHEK